MRLRCSSVAYGWDDVLEDSLGNCASVTDLQSPQRRVQSGEFWRLCLLDASVAEERRIKPQPERHRVEKGSSALAAEERRSKCLSVKRES